MPERFGWILDSYDVNSTRDKDFFPLSLSLSSILWLHPEDPLSRAMDSLEPLHFQEFYEDGWKVVLRKWIGKVAVHLQGNIQKRNPKISQNHLKWIKRMPLRMKSFHQSFDLHWFAVVRWKTCSTRRTVKTRRWSLRFCHESHTLQSPRGPKRRKSCTEDGESQPSPGRSCCHLCIPRV